MPLERSRVDKVVQNLPSYDRTQWRRMRDTDKRLRRNFKGTIIQLCPRLSQMFGRDTQNAILAVSISSCS